MDRDSLVRRQEELRPRPDHRRRLAARVCKGSRHRGPACVFTFRLSTESCAAARFRRAPFFRPVWFPNIAGIVIDPTTDWDELDELIRDSYRVLAPKKLGGTHDAVVAGAKRTRAPVAEPADRLPPSRAQPSGRRHGAP